MEHTKKHFIKLRGSLCSSAESSMRIFFILSVQKTTKTAYIHLFAIFSLSTSYTSKHEFHDILSSFDVRNKKQAAETWHSIVIFTIVEMIFFVWKKSSVRIAIFFSTNNMASLVHCFGLNTLRVTSFGYRCFCSTRADVVFFQSISKLTAHSWKTQQAMHLN